MGVVFLIYFIFVPENMECVGFGRLALEFGKEGYADILLWLLLRNACQSFFSVA